MPQYSSKVTIARPKSTSLRTTIPEGIAKLIDLEAGDEIVWDAKIIARGVEVTVGKSR